MVRIRDTKQLGAWRCQWWASESACGKASCAWRCFESVRVNSNVFSPILGVIGCSCFWSILEFFEQKKCVEIGWLPKNPKRVNQENYNNQNQSDTGLIE